MMEEQDPFSFSVEDIRRRRERRRFRSLPGRRTIVRSITDQNYTQARAAGVCVCVGVLCVDPLPLPLPPPPPPPILGGYIEIRSSFIIDPGYCRVSPLFLSVCFSVEKKGRVKGLAAMSEY